MDCGHSITRVVLDPPLGCSIEDWIVHVGPQGLCKPRSGVELSVEHAVSVEEVQEALGGHLVAVLGEHLPGLHERRQVLHLPPEVNSLKVQGVSHV